MAATRWHGCEICGRLGCLLWCVAVAAGVVPDAGGAAASSGEALAVALEANWELAERQWAEIAGLQEQVARLVERDAEREAELEELRAGFACWSGCCSAGRPRSLLRGRLPAPVMMLAAGHGIAGNGKDVKRGPGSQAGRWDYSHLPRFEVFWDSRGRVLLPVPTIIGASPCSINEFPQL